jgi:ABC-type Fe3+ transport system substrate-binding protein
MKKVASVLLVIGLITVLLGAGVLSGCAEEEKVPTLTGVSPGSCKVGETISVTITGTDLTDASAVSFGSGITVDSYTVDSETQITASITVSSGATLGTGISPASGEQAESLDVTITGSNFINVSDVSLGEGVTVDSYTVDSATQISASITIAPNALEAPRDVSVTNTSGPGTGGGIFTVTWPAALDAIIAAAEDEGVLNILVGGGMEIYVADDIKEGINEKYGIDIEINFAPGQSTPRGASQLILEYQAGEKAHTDVFWGMEPHMPGLYDADVLATYNWTELFPYIPDETVQLEGTVVEANTKFRGFTYNTNAIPPNEVPRNVEDILGKGYDIASTIYAAGFDRLAMLPDWGFERTKQFMLELTEEITGLLRCSDVDRVSSGEFTMLFFDCGGRTEVAKWPGAPLAFAMFEDAPMTLHDYNGVPKHSEHPNLAVLWTGYMMSLDGQQIIDEHMGRSHHLVEGTGGYLENEELIAQGIEVTDFTSDYVYDYLDELSVWRAEFQAILQGG